MTPVWSKQSCIFRQSEFWFAQIHVRRDAERVAALTGSRLLGSASSVRVYKLSSTSSQRSVTAGVRSGDER